MSEAIMAILAAVFALFGIGVAVKRKLHSQPQPQPQPESVRKAEVIELRSAERRALRDDTLSMRVQQIHTETKAAVASKRASREDAARQLKELRAWDDGSDL